MVAITAIYDAQGVKDTKIHVYYSNQDQNLGFQFRDEDGNQDRSQNTLDAGSDAHTGIVLYNSHLSSTTRWNKEFVFGVTVPKSFTINNGNSCNNQCPPPTSPVDISLVSPVYKIVGRTTSQYYKIASASSTDNAWVYYFTQGEDGLQINEGAIGIAGKADFSSIPPILKTSALAAYYLPKTKHRYVIYQAKTGLLREFDINAGKDNTIYKGAGVQSGTSLGVAVTADTVYLYYADSNGNLSRVTKSIDGDAKWTTPATVDAADATVDPASQIAVTIADNYNHIFYKANDQASGIGFTHVLDDQTPNKN